MSNNINPGIRILSIKLKRIDFTINKSLTGNVELNVNFRIDRNLNEKEKKLDILFGIMINPIKEPTDFHILVEMIGSFSASNDNQMPLEKFSRVNALAIMLPYLREIITSVTSKSELPPIYLPPINVNEIVEKEEELKKDSYESQTHTYIDT